MKKDYDSHFNAAFYENKKQKEKKAERNRRTRWKKSKRFQMKKDGLNPTFTVVKEKNIYERVPRVVEAYDEEEKCFYIVKHTAFDEKGNPVQRESYEWRKTGRIIHHPRKVYYYSRLIETVPCKPYLCWYSLSGRKTFAKKMTAKLFRRSFVAAETEDGWEDVSKIPSTRKGYKHSFDYWNEVW